MATYLLGLKLNQSLLNQNLLCLQLLLNCAQVSPTLRVSNLGLTMACRGYFHGACDGITFYMEPHAQIRMSLMQAHSACLLIGTGIHVGK